MLEFHLRPTQCLKGTIKFESIFTEGTLKSSMTTIRFYEPCARTVERSLFGST